MDVNIGSHWSPSICITTNEYVGRFRAKSGERFHEYKPQGDGDLGAFGSIVLPLN